MAHPANAWRELRLRCLHRRWVRQRDDLLNGEIFTTLRKAQLLIESWRRTATAPARTHRSAIGRPAPQAILPPVRTDNYPAVFVTKSAEDRSRNDPAKPLNRTNEASAINNHCRHLLSSTFCFASGTRSLPLKLPDLPPR
jgi:hypothetical protein